MNKNTKSNKNTNETITIRKDIFLTLMNLLSLSAFAISEEANAIFRECDLGKHIEFQGKNFSHERNYDRIIEKLRKMFEASRLVFDAIPADDISITECVEGVLENKKFKELLKYYGADLVGNGNFDKI